MKLAASNHLAWKKQCKYFLTSQLIHKSNHDCSGEILNNNKKVSPSGGYSLEE